jgi:hypothetical protein
MWDHPNDSGCNAWHYSNGMSTIPDTHWIQDQLDWLDGKAETDNIRLRKERDHYRELYLTAKVCSCEQLIKQFIKHGKCLESSCEMHEWRLVNLFIGP